jgi:hypothetical protein
LKQCCGSQAASLKLQARNTSVKPQANQNLVQVLKTQASSQRLKLPDASIKPFAVRLKLQATSVKLLDNFSLIKFYKVKAEGLNHNKCLDRMFHMESNLMWREADCVSSSDLKFYGKKVAARIKAQ